MITTCPTSGYVLDHDPLILNQIASCTGTGSPDEPHAVHRQVTGLVMYACNCGANTGWVSRETVPLAEEFLLDHLPPGADADAIRKAIGGGVE